jgi:hypothetical protein
MLIAVIGLLMAAGSVYSVVPRIRLVEAITLFATAFGAGVAFALAIAERRRQTS